VTTHPHREDFAAGNLERQGFTVYCPKIMKRIRHARRIYDAARPLFPGYIFAESVSGRAHLRSLLGTHGVRSVVLSGQVPARLPGRFVEALKAREAEGVIVRSENPLVPGLQVAIEGGPFDGLAAQIVAIGEYDRVLVLLHFLQQKTKVYIDAKALKPGEPPAPLLAGGAVKQA
jgi:transcriptional antiterminator RfaH